MPNDTAYIKLHVYAPIYPTIKLQCQNWTILFYPSIILFIDIKPLEIQQLSLDSTCI